MEMVKSQASVEMTVILAALLTVFVIILSVNSDISSLFTSKYSKDQANLALNSVCSYAEFVYNQGEGARKQISITLPSNIYNSSISNQTIEFNLYSSKVGYYSQIYCLLDFDVNGTLPNSSGDYIITLSSVGSFVNVTY